MAIIQLTKAHIIGSKKHKLKVLHALQQFGSVELHEVDLKDKEELDKHFDASTTQSDHELELTRANLEFTIKLLDPYANKRGALEGPVVVNEKKAKSVAESLDYKSIIETCLKLENKMTQAETTLELLENAEKELAPWKNVETSPQEGLSAKNYELAYLVIRKDDEAAFKKALADISPLQNFDSVHRDNTKAYVALIFNKNISKEVKSVIAKYKAKEVQLPAVQSTVKDALHNIHEQKKDARHEITTAQAELKKLAANYETLQIIHDYLKWQLDLIEKAKEGRESTATFIYSAWIPKNQLQEIENTLKDKTNNKVAVVEVETDEMAPVALKNHPLLEPIENVTTLYGLPIPSEYDPTAFLSIFFVAFFGMAVTDAGYGIVMTVSMLLVLKYVKLSKQIRSFVKLLMYAGVLTFIMGLLYGGWFGMTIDQAPDFLLTGTGEDKRFIAQIFNPIEDPMTVLILSLIVGYIQVAFGVLISFLSELKSGNKKVAFLDHLSWFVTLVSLAVLIMFKSGVIGGAIGLAGTYVFYASLVFLVLTQGRDKKNIVAKLFSGILSLYGLVGYFGDILSYSRLLALGLATAIIGLAVNIVAGLASGLPYIGWLLVIIVLIGGHLFNLVVNALGAFIHSARLQFVEFFSKFLIGGGRAFKPFKKRSKYVLLDEEM